MTEKPKQFREEYAGIFQDASVVAAYEHRPPYPVETFTVLRGLIPTTVTQQIVLDAGCGTGFITRPLAAYVDHIDAVDISARMIAAGKTLPGGDRPNISWIAAAIETAPLTGPYALITAAASLHWMDWDVTLPRFAAHVVAGGVLALVEESGPPSPWDAIVGPILAHYSMNVDYAPYDMGTVAADLEQRGLFRLQGRYETAPVRFRQRIASWVESFHARNGFSRDRMESQAATDFDDELRAAVLPHCPGGLVEQHVAARIFWGVPYDISA